MRHASEPLPSRDGVIDAWERIRRTTRAAEVLDGQGDRAESTPAGGGDLDRAVLEPVGHRAAGRHAVPVDWTGPLRAITVVTLLAMALAAVLFWRASPRAIDPRDDAPVDGSVAAALSGVAPGTGSPDGASLVVHVIGAVRAPGVVRLTPGARVADAIKAAGGLRPGVAADLINLARPVSDGEQVVVGAAPAAGQGLGPGRSATGSPTDATDGDRVDLNTATVDELEALDGIGPVLAERIVAWRTEHGRFSRIEDLRDVSGVGPKIFDRLTAQVTV